MEYIDLVKLETDADKALDMIMRETEGSMLKLDWTRVVVLDVGVLGQYGSFSLHCDKLAG